MSQVRIVSGPHQGESVDGDKLAWYVGATHVFNGHIYRREHGDQAIYEGEVPVVEVEDGDS